MVPSHFRTLLDSNSLSSCCSWKISRFQESGNRQCLQIVPLSFHHRTSRENSTPTIFPRPSTTRYSFVPLSCKYLFTAFLPAFKLCNMSDTIMTLVLLLFTSVFMLPVIAAHASQKSCVDFTIHLTLTATDLIWGRPKFESTIDLTSMIFDFNRK